MNVNENNPDAEQSAKGCLARASFKVRVSRSYDNFNDCPQGRGPLSTKETILSGSLTGGASGLLRSGSYVWACVAMCLGAWRRKKIRQCGTAPQCPGATHGSPP